MGSRNSDIGLPWPFSADFQIAQKAAQARSSGPMRYLYLFVLLAAIALGICGLEATHVASGTAPEIIQESEIGPYLVAGLLIGIFLAFTSPASVSRFFWLYGKVRTPAQGFVVMLGFGLAIVVTLSA